MSFAGFGVECPCCAWTPTGEARWTCPCGEGAFDIFAQRGRCPGCDRRESAPRCARCSEARPWSSWFHWEVGPVDGAIAAVLLLLIVLAARAPAVAQLVEPRAAVTAAAEGQRPDDPWGRPLRARIVRRGFGGAEVTLYSLGPDGLDQAGKGDDLEAWPRASDEWRAVRDSTLIAVIGVFAAAISAAIARLVVPKLTTPGEWLVAVLAVGPFGLYLWASTEWLGAWLEAATRHWGLGTSWRSVAAAGIAASLAAMWAIRRAAA